MRAKVYLETTIPSYLTARRSRDLVVAAHQEITIDWWNDRRNRFDLFASELVLEEVRRGDPELAARRLKEMKNVKLLEVNEEARELARQLLHSRILPITAQEDALHVATATAHGVDYLLTWNCRHIANAQIAALLADLVDRPGYQMPMLCTPEQLMGD
jgi:predicted nucleic acid-binding protein